MIIGVTGAIGSGKNTVARVLVEEHGFEQIEIADKLKEVCLELFQPLGASARHFFGTQEQKMEPFCDGLTGRRVLEHVGTEGFRALHPDVWLRYAFNIIDRQGGDWVIPGLRFQNEAEEVRRRGGELWLVECVGGPNEGAATGHESDAAWRRLNYDRHLIARYGDIDGLRAQVAIARNPVLGERHA